MSTAVAAEFTQTGLIAGCISTAESTEATTSMNPAVRRSAVSPSGGTGGAEFSTFISSGYDMHLGHLTRRPDCLAPVHLCERQCIYGERLASAVGDSFAVCGVTSDRLWLQNQLRLADRAVLVEPSLRAAWEHEFRFRLSRSLPVLRESQDHPALSLDQVKVTTARSSARASQSIGHIQFRPTSTTTASSGAATTIRML